MWQVMEEWIIDLALCALVAGAGLEAHSLITLLSAVFLKKNIQFELEQRQERTILEWFLLLGHRDSLASAWRMATQYLKEHSELMPDVSASEAETGQLV